MSLRMALRTRLSEIPEAPGLGADPADVAVDATGEDTSGDRIVRGPFDAIGELPDLALERGDALLELLRVGHVRDATGGMAGGSGVPATGVARESVRTIGSTFCRAATP